MQPFVYSIRYNRQKYALPAAQPVPWEPEATFTDKQEFILDPLWHAGAYYVQESNSMFLGYILDQIGLSGNPHAMVLDLCAAPGGKSTHILSKMHPEALLVANEVIPKRNAILRENLIRWGYPNVIVTQNEPQDFAGLQECFDVVVVDAPCSGEGLFRKDPEAQKEWSEENVAMCALRQRDILTDILPSIKPGGYLLYSTCTFQEVENEAQVAFLLSQGLESVPVDTSAFPQITPGNLPHTYRFTFEQTAGSGFFITCLKKGDAAGTAITKSRALTIRHRANWETTSWPEAGEWIKAAGALEAILFREQLHVFPQAWMGALRQLSEFLRLAYIGVEAGTLKKALFLPAHALALSLLLHPDLPRWELSREEALAYLRKQTLAVPDISIPTANTDGWCIVTYQHLPLGWVKLLPNRVNNYLPTNWRILK